MRYDIRRLAKNTLAIASVGACAAGFGFLGVTGSGYIAKYHYNVESSKRQQSPIRQYFKQHTGIPVRGYERDVEGQKRGLAQIMNAVEVEHAERPFRVTSIDIVGVDFHDDIFEAENGKKYAGSYDLDDRSIRVNVSTFEKQRSWRVGRTKVTTKDAREVTHHEVKHAKAHDVETEHPGFFKEWERLSAGQYDDSQQDSFHERIIATLLGYEKTEEVPPYSNALARQGFVTPYARTNVKEDIAELCKEAEIHPWRFAEWDRKRYPIIWKKLALAQKNKLIPAHFMEETLAIQQEQYMSEATNNGTGNISASNTVTHATHEKRSTR